MARAGLHEVSRGLVPAGSRDGSFARAITEGHSLLQDGERQYEL